MSQREYLLVDEQRVYEWDRCPKVEFVCDICNEPIADDAAQMHLHIRRGTVQREDGKTSEVEWFGIDLHLSCVSSSSEWLAGMVESKTRPEGRSPYVSRSLSESYTY
jgi:hypothetical protein